MATKSGRDFFQLAQETKTDADVAKDYTFGTHVTQAIANFQKFILEHRRKSTLAKCTMGDADWPITKDIPVFTKEDLAKIQWACGMKIVMRKEYHDSNDKDISGDYFYDIYTDVPVNETTLVRDFLNGTK